MSLSHNNSTEFNLTPDEIREGIRRCREKVISLLECALTLTANPSGREISSGLYTFAVEELGKLLLLKQELSKIPINNKIMIDSEIFGVRNGRAHTNKKFDRFLNEPTISQKCKKIRIVVGGVYSKHGGFAIHNEEFVDFILRKKIFYVDWKNEQWIRHQDFEMSDLSTAINELKIWIGNNIQIS